MGYIRAKRADCKSCCKCIKECPVKSVSYTDNKVDIIDEGCILCGRCIGVCPRGAKILDNDIEYIKKLLKTEQVYVSLAPDFIAAYGNKYKRLITALKRLGFSHVEESSVGGACVTQEYRRLILTSKGRTIISSACPSVNLYIKKYYPELLPFLAPVMIPSQAHSRLIKMENPKAKVVYIGSCLANLGLDGLDGGLLYPQLNGWLREAGIDLDTLEESEFDRPSAYSRIYPIQGGITKDIINIFDDYTGTEKAGGYNLLCTAGLEGAKRVLDELSIGAIENAFVEIWACEGGCIGSIFNPTKPGMFEKRIRVKDYADSSDPEASCLIANISTEHRAEPYTEPEPTEADIKEILIQMGKYTRAQELNCGICGYPTCREKAKAVYQKKADIQMCLPYLLNINQSLSNTVLSLTPNMIIAVDSALIIKEFNVSAQRIFRKSRQAVIGKRVSELIDDKYFKQVFETKTSIFDLSVTYENLGLMTEQSIIYSPEHDLAIATIHDVTDEQVARKKAYDKKMRSLELAQKVIDKQMFVAQEIASLLGETTAETKVALSKLKSLIALEDDENG